MTRKEEIEARKLELREEIEATEEVEDFAALLNTDEVQNVFSGCTTEETALII